MVNNQLINLFRQNTKFVIGFRYIIYVLHTRYMLSFIKQITEYW